MPYHHIHKTSFIWNSKHEQAGTDFHFFRNAFSPPISSQNLSRSSSSLCHLYTHTSHSQPLRLYSFCYVIISHGHWSLILTILVDCTNNFSFRTITVYHIHLTISLSLSSIFLFTLPCHAMSCPTLVHLLSLALSFPIFLHHYLSLTSQNLIIKVTKVRTIRSNRIHEYNINVIEYVSS